MNCRIGTSIYVERLKASFAPSNCLHFKKTIYANEKQNMERETMPKLPIHYVRTKKYYYLTLRKNIKKSPVPPV